MAVGTYPCFSCLNPCFCGTYFSSFLAAGQMGAFQDGLNPCFCGTYFSRGVKK